MRLPDYYEFCCRVKTISGPEALEQIPSALEILGAEKPMLITDRGVSEAGLINILKKAIGKKVKIGATYNDVPPDSDLKIVNKVAQKYQKSGCDSIIAVGGGSVIDTAKGVNIIVSENSDDLMKFTGVGSLKRPLKPLIAVPTTSGTGSEMTLVAVIADHDNNIKMAFVSYFLLPDIAILDPRMTKTLPDFLTTLTAMDAMTHAIEAYTCLAKNPVSDVHALEAIKLISQNLLNVIKKPADMKGRIALANGSALGGIAFSNSMVGVVHALGHATGGVCNAPHGICMSILLPYGLEYNMHKSGHLTGELLFALAGEDIYRNTKKNERADRAIEYIRQMNQDLHDATGGKHARYFKELFDKNGNQIVKREVLPDIAATALKDGALNYNPEDLDYDDLLMVIEHAWEGTPLNRSKIKKGSVTREK